MANMAFTFLPEVTGEGLLIIVHTSERPTDLEWAPYFQELVRHDPRTLRSLAFTDGGAPGGAQRKQVNDFLRGQPSLGAVVSANFMVRGAVTALSWFNPQIRAFGPEDLDAALRYLRVRPLDLSSVHDEIQSLRRRLGHDGLKSIIAS